MSLDVYLTVPGANRKTEPGIFIRENGETREISAEEWARRFPDREPVRYLPEDVTTDEVFSANITHNLNKMAEACGLYTVLWRPEDIGAKKAWQIKGPLEIGLMMLKHDPERYKKYNPENGWGDYDGLVRFAEGYLKACLDYPGADVEVTPMTSAPTPVPPRLAEARAQLQAAVAKGEIVIAPPSEASKAELEAYRNDPRYKTHYWHPRFGWAPVEPPAREACRVAESEGKRDE